MVGPLRQRPGVRHALVCLCLGLLCASCQSPQSAGASRRVDVLCHYMSWFQWRSQGGVDTESHWSWGGAGTPHDPVQVEPTGLRDICSVYYPRIGVYDSADPDVVDYHILTAKAAGIDGFVVDWYGPGNAVDAALQVLFDRAEALDFRVAVCLEEKSCFPDWNRQVRDRAEATSACATLLADVAARYAGRASYWRHDGRPGVFVFNGWGDWPGHGIKTFTGAEWHQIAKQAGAEHVAVIPQHFDLDDAFVRAAFGWCGDRKHVRWVREHGDSRLADGSLDFYVAPASPGFDDRGVWGWGGTPRLTPRLGTETYAHDWAQIARGKAGVVQIVTWNDFAEGTVIEPTVQWGHQFIDETERHVATLTGREADLTDNALPYRWFVARKRAPEQAQRLDRIRAMLADGLGAQAAGALDTLAIPTALYVDAATEPPRFEVWTPEDRERQTLLSEIDAALMQAASATASSEESAEHRAVAAIDGKLTTRWASLPEDNQWLQLTWPQPVEARTLLIAWETAFASAYDVLTSRDGTTWQPAAQVRDGKGGVDRVALPDTPFRYLRLACRQRGTQWGVSIHEIGLVP